MYMFVFGAARKPAPLDIGRKAIFIVLYLNMHIIEINAKPPEDTDGHEHSLLYKIPAVWKYAADSSDQVSATAARCPLAY